ncbi:MAG: hypothetical protein ACR2J8_05880 [Thermomicrobiales bacterium]
MFDLQDRRSALTRLAAGAAAAGIAVREMTSEAAAQAETEGNKQNKPQYFWKLPWGQAIFTKVGSDPLRYNAVVGAFGEGMIKDMWTGKTRTVTDKQAERMLMKKTNKGRAKGIPQIQLNGIKWRVLTADYDPASKTWHMALRICDSNPNARPVTGVSVRSTGDVSAQGGDSGCSCSCDTASCYVCSPTKVQCGLTCVTACGGNCQ